MLFVSIPLKIAYFVFVWMFFIFVLFMVWPVVSDTKFAHEIGAMLPAGMYNRPGVV